VSQCIPCGVELDRYCPGAEKTVSPSILFLGDLSSRKRGALLVEAFSKEVITSHPECRLTIVGPQHVSGNGIRHLGNIDEAALIDEYRRAWIYCMPSSYEGFGVPAIEAMACGTPVVATANAGVREIIRHESNGIISPDGMLGLWLNRIISDASLRKALEENGLRTVRTAFDIRSTAGEYHRLYMQASTGGPQ
jgi:glycosyltransferase involved in cell wall biosynthesis